LTVTGRIVSFTDCSTDPEGSATVYVNWGDGKPVEAFSMSSVPSHTYAFNGTYNITHWVQDSGGKKATEMKSVTVPAKYKVTVTTSPATSGALVRVKLAGVLKSQGYTKSTAPVGTFTSVGLDPNIYDVTISKAGSTFTCDSATADLTAGNATIACTVTTP
jgi:PKD repeat protein